MAVNGDDRLRQAIDQQALLVAAAENALSRAERAVTQARSPSAATEAHQRADAALIELELAEAQLHRLSWPQAVPVEPAKRHPRLRPTAHEQTPLFEVS
jgi:Tfp pilus assembly protein PilX